METEAAHLSNRLDGSNDLCVCDRGVDHDATDTDELVPVDEIEVETIPGRRFEP